FGASDRWWEQTDLTKLLLSSNHISQISEDIRLLPALVTLDLHDNQLNTLHSAIGELQELQTLRLSHNQLSSLPVEVCMLRNLRSLTLQQNLLENLPEEFGQLENLTELDLSKNRLTDLPQSLGRLTGLQKISLSHNKLSCLPDCLSQLTNVKLLDCSNNQLSDVPASLAHMLSLEQLHLRHNRLQRLPQLHAPALKELYVGNNQVGVLEAEQLECLKAISVLELRDNKIRAIPEQMSLLHTLTRLDLTNNDIGSLPASLSLLPNLKVLLVEGNPLRGIRRDLLTKGTNELLKYLRGRVKGDSEDPPTAMTFPSQARINVHSIKTLGVLDYSDMQADSIPEEAFLAAEGQNVVTANFSKNKLTSIPARNNQLKDLPADMENLAKLRCIILSYNRFKSFPEVLYQMFSMETVLMANNQVSGVDPARLARLEHLSTLDLSNNDLLSIPPELGLCTSLRSLSLQGNPFRTPRAAIVAKGTDAVLEYLRSRIPA
uniref:Leucine rich repeat containing 40 n=1 Tax=Oryzias sinensis TaxID=183150 RepID=A0A8C7XWV3_9TELE